MFFQLRRAVKTCCSLTTSFSFICAIDTIYIPVAPPILRYTIGLIEHIMPTRKLIWITLRWCYKRKKLNLFSGKNIFFDTQHQKGRFFILISCGLSFYTQIIFYMSLAGHLDNVMRQ